MKTKVKLTIPYKFEVIKNLIRDRFKKQPATREVYAVGTGTYVGEMFVYVKKDSGNYYFLSIPKNINRSIPIDKFEWAMQYKIAEFVQKLPGKVYQICAAQYKHNESTVGAKELTIK